MSREAQIIRMLDKILAQQELIISFLPDEVKARLARQTLRREFEDAMNQAATGDTKLLKQFWRDHPDESREFIKKSPSTN